MFKKPAEIVSVLDATAIGCRLREIASELAREGGRAVLVGGAVRDGVLGLPVKDLDVEVFGLELEQLRSVLARYGEVIAVGQAFGVLMIRGLKIDFSLPREDSKVAPGHRGFDVVFDPALSFEVASQRRDLTINSMGIDLETAQLLDPHGGWQDLEAGILRATSRQSFGEDPLRGLRVAQFVARFDMEIDPALVSLCGTLDLSELPGERLLEEFRKLLLKGQKPSRGLAFLRESGLLRFFPELEALIDVPQDPGWHPEGDVWVHTLMSIDAGVKLRGDEDRDRESETGSQDAEALMFAVLCHDLGKPATTGTVEGRIRSIAHESVGVEATRAFLARLRAPSELSEQVVALVEHHLAPAQLIAQQSGPKAFRRLARKLGEAGLSMHLLERVARADHLGRTTDDARAGRFPAGDAFLEQAGALEIVVDSPRDVVLGRHLIARGYEPGTQFGEILERCREVQDETGLRDPESILDRVLEG